jgi:hypothetical protein
MDRGDVGVRQSRHGLGLAQQRGLAAGAVAVGREQLDRHGPVEVWIDRRVDDAHTPGADLAPETVAPDHTFAVRLPTAGGRWRHAPV